MNSYSVKIDTEKAFDSLDYDFIIPASKNFVFKSNFIARIKTFLVEQESCDINGGVTTQYFRLKSCTSGRPYIRISFYFMIRNSAYFDKNNENIEFISTFEKRYLYTVIVKFPE